MNKPKTLCLLIVIGAAVVLALLRFTGEVRDGGVATARLAPAIEGPEAEAVLSSADVVAASGSVRSGVTRVEAREAEVEPEAVADPARVATNRTLTLTARIVDSDSNPIVGAQVVLQADIQFGVSGAAGIVDETRTLDKALRKVLLGRQGPAPTVTVLAPGFAGKRRPITWNSTDTTIRLGTFVLDPGRDLRGVVLGGAGEPVAGASVGWQSSAAPDEQGGRSINWDFWMHRPEAVTDTDGRFVMRGAPIGWCVVHGGAPDLEPGQTDPFEVTLGFLEEIVLVLPRPAPRYSIAGVVLRPDGQPAALATIDWMDTDGTWGFSAPSVHADEEGRFRLDLDGDVSVTLRASAADEAFFPAELERIRPGGPDVEIRLGEPVWLDITLVDSAGDAIPWSHMKLKLQRDSIFNPRAQEPCGEDGTLRVMRPGESFTVEAMARGYRRETFGPFEPLVVSEGPLRITMKPGGTIQGTVLHAGQAVSGAAVMLTESHAGELSYSQRLTPREWPFAMLASTRSSQPDATTDSTGDFSATLHINGKHSVRIVADGFPTTNFGLFEWTQDIGARDLVFELKRGGALEGRVLGPDGSTVEGTVVGASDGWGIAYTCVADEQGRYRFDDLQPGSWQVRSCLRPARTSAGVILRSGNSNRNQAHVPWDCTVQSGETTTFDLDLAGLGSHVLSGVIEIGERAAAGCTISLIPADGDRVFGPVLGVTRTDDEGRFELAFSRGGPRLVRVTLHGWSMWQEIELVPGRTQWNVQFEVGSLAFRRRPDADKQDLWGHNYRHETPAGVVVERFLNFNALGDEDVLFTEVPAGRGQVLRRNRGIMANVDVSDDERWTVVLEVDVRAGQLTTVELP